MEAEAKTAMVNTSGGRLHRILEINDQINVGASIQSVKW